MIENPVIRQGLIVAGLIYLLWSVNSLEINWTRVSVGIPRAANILARMFPPNFGRWQLLVNGTLESVQMALAASFLGMIPVTILSATTSNISILPASSPAKRNLPDA